MILLALGCGGPGSVPPTDTDPLTPTLPPTYVEPSWEPGDCGVTVVDGVRHVDRCRAWVSSVEGEGFGYRVRGGELASGPHLAVGSVCQLTDWPCNTGIRLMGSTAYGMFEPETHTWMRDRGQGILGVGFDFVGSIGSSDEPLIADKDHYGLVALREPSNPPETITAEHPDLLCDVEDNEIYTHACGDVTGNGHPDLCHQAYTTRVFEGPVTAHSEPWMTALGPSGPGSVGAFGHFRAGEPALVFGYYWHEEFRGGVAYLPLIPGHQVIEATDFRFVGAEPGDRVGDGMGAGDLDGDGDFELVVGRTFDDERTGSIKVYSDTQDDPLGAVVLELAGEVRHIRFGWESLVADFNGDGHPDLVVAAPGSLLLNLPGNIHIFPGPLEQMSWDSAVTWTSGAAHNDQFGVSMAAFDQDGDGDLELIVGAPYFSQVAYQAGAVFSIEDPLPE